MFDLQGEAKGLKLALELSAIICAHFCGVTENLEHLLAQGVCHRLAALVVDKCQDAELAKAADHAQDVNFAVLIT